MFRYIRDFLFLRQVSRFIDDIISAVRITAVVEPDLTSFPLYLASLRVFMEVRGVSEAEIAIRLEDARNRYTCLIESVVDRSLIEVRERHAVLEMLPFRIPGDWNKLPSIEQIEEEVHLSVAVFAFLCSLYEPTLNQRDRHLLPKIFRICSRKCDNADVSRYRAMRGV